MNKDHYLSELKQSFHILDTIELDTWQLDFSLTTFERFKSTIQKSHQSEFEDNQRLIIVTDRQQFKNSGSYINFLGELQRIINEVDISNFFVIILHNDQANQETIQKKCGDISTDPIPMSFVCYHTDSLGTNLTAPKDLLNDSKVFCMLPWTHLMITPYNEVRPCCNSAGKIGDLGQHSLAEAWNSKEMKQLRLSMLNESYHHTCVECYEREKIGGLSPRKHYNSALAKFAHMIESTRDDGYLEEFKLRHIDFRFSNLCNLRCRICNHHSSSKWYADEKKLNPSYDKPFIMKAGKHELDVWEQLVPHIDFIESIYFAGGEPLMMDEHYWLLEELEKRKMYDVRIYYNTNFTAVKQKQRHLFDYWKNFKNITVATSQDGSDLRGEYLRKDSKWNTIVENIKMVKAQLPNVEIKIACTVSLINSAHVCQFHRQCVADGLIEVDDFIAQLLLEPTYHRLDVAPHKLKIKLEKIYLEHIEWLGNKKANRATVDYFYRLINFLHEKDNSDHLEEFKQITARVDAIRNENILTVFPELSELYE